MSHKWFRALTGLAAASLLLAACGGAATTAAPLPTEAPAATAPPQEVEVTREVEVQSTVVVEVPAQVAPTGGLLDAVKGRGQLVCGVNGGLPGFSNLEADGSFSGFDADFCRAIAVAVLGDPEAVEFRALSTTERFTALQTGEVDVLIRNTTRTFQRDSELGLAFAPTTFYDGQGILIQADLGVTDLEGLEGGTICVQAGTTTELNLADQLGARGISYEPVVFDDIDPTYAAYEEGRCDAVTSDRSQLVGRRSAMADPEAHILLDAVLSKEPLAPATLQGDALWNDVVTWTVYGVIAAEEKGITSENVDTFADTTDPEIQRMLGIGETALGSMLGLEAGWLANVIREVGNYGEIYARNLGPDTPLNIQRGPNELWTNGGLLYSPPFR
jgi:general L-amino acid transport system substrate-binding protein